ncbi:hypothetical protein F5876DRAFT_70092, partial [Lentinula aff. lateritia]
TAIVYKHYVFAVCSMQDTRSYTVVYAPVRTLQLSARIIRNICHATNMDLQPPDLMIWSYETGRESQDQNDAYLLLYVAQNSSEDLKMVEEHKEEIITKSIEAIGFTFKMREKCKWYRMK